MYGKKEFVALLTSSTTEYSRATFIKNVYFLRIELVVKLVFEMKSAVEFLSSYIYDYRFARSSPITPNLALENDLLAWPIASISSCLPDDFPT